ncbi:MAG: hypothetical protein L0170_01025 [Acidobacteria bacterium]|nr:hypothetical protein [Acidobacteriota bacterium]
MRSGFSAPSLHTPSLEGGASPIGGQVTYFLGAGATRADYPSIPLMDELLHEILRTGSAENLLQSFLAEIFGPECLRPEAQAQERPRIDDVFTLIDASLSGKAPSPGGKSREVLIEARRHLIASIGRAIAKTIGEDHGRVARKFATVLPEGRTTLISTNYDIVMDNALLERSPKNVNYGVPVREAVHRRGDLIAGRFDEIHHYRSIPGSQETIRRGGIPLLKLNGSLNWLYCPRCDELDITLLQDRGALTLLDEPKLGRCYLDRCTSPYEPVLVGPSLEQRYEHRVLRDTWTRAERALLASNRLVIIGYSIPDADYLVRAMLARTFAARSHLVTVVTMPMTPSDQRILEQRFKRLFPHSTFLPEGFEHFVESFAAGRANREVS